MKWWAFALALASFLRAPNTFAEAHVLVEARPVFGDGTPASGFLDVLVRIENETGSAIAGNVEVESEGHAPTKMPLTVLAHSTTNVELPARVEGRATVRVVRKSGEEVARTALRVENGRAPFFVSDRSPSSVATALRAHVFPSPYRPSDASHEVHVGSPGVGFSFPESREGYAAVTVLLLHSGSLLAMTELQIQALERWVECGGELALVLEPSHETAERVSRFVGGTVKGTEVKERSPFPALVPLPALVPHKRTARRHWVVRRVAAATPHVRATKVGPSEPFRKSWRGYVGGTLQEGRFGATAKFGLGEVHLLPFDPDSEVASAERFAHAKLMELLAYAWERESSRMTSPVALSGWVRDLVAVRKRLDPNEGYGTLLLLSCGVLVLYAVFVGPVVFGTARRKNRPMATLQWVPLLSVATFLILVLVGTFVKGFRGGLRTFSIAELSSEQREGPLRRFRGYFSSGTETLSATTSGLLHRVEEGEEPGTFFVGRTENMLSELPALSWQLVFLEEFSTQSWGQGIALRRRASGETQVENLSGFPLRRVLVHAPGEGIFFFQELVPTAKVLAKEGRLLAKVPVVSVTSGLAHHALSDLVFGTKPTKAERELLSTWHTAVGAVPHAVDLFPEKTLVLLAEVADTKANLSQSTLLVRVMEQDTP